jgi:hypothetical protein
VDGAKSRFFLPLAAAALVAGVVLGAVALNGQARSQSGQSLDLIWTKTDDTGFPLNPSFQYQTTHSDLPDVETECSGLGSSGYSNYTPQLGNPPCVTPPPVWDNQILANIQFCAGIVTGRDYGAFRGHLNLRPATFVGTAYWDSKSNQAFDQDYNINFVTPPQPGFSTPPALTNKSPTVNGTPSLHGEFDSRETIDNFSTPWWNALHHAVDTGDPSQSINGHAAVVTGLIGLDGDHEVATESHPVYLLAISEANGARSRTNDTWAFFVRNWGDEGPCSSHDHPMGAGIYTITIPWWPGADDATVSLVSAEGTNGVTSAPGFWMHKYTGGGVILWQFLDDGRKHEAVDGAFSITWHFPPDTKPRPEINKYVAANPGADTDQDGDQALGALISKLPASSEQAIEHIARQRAYAFVRTLRYRGRGKIVKPPSPPRPPVLRPVANPKGTRVLVRTSKALCAAYHGKLPGFPRFCPEVAKIP